jgi:hypothetical protein
MGPKNFHSTVLTAEEEAMVVDFRKHTSLPRDDCLYLLQATIPHLRRSSRHRCLQRHGINRLRTSSGVFGRPPRGRERRKYYFPV